MVQTSLAGRTQYWKSAIDRAIENAVLISERPYLKALGQKSQ